MTNYEQAAEEYRKTVEPVMHSDEWRTELYSETDMKRAFLAGCECARPKWRDAKTDPPEINKPVQIYTSYEKQATAFSSYGWKEVDGKIVEDLDSYQYVDWMRPEHSYGSVIHWMPLPEKPEGEG